METNELRRACEMAGFETRTHNTPERPGFVAYIGGNWHADNSCIVPMCVASRLVALANAVEDDYKRIRAAMEVLKC